MSHKKIILVGVPLGPQLNRIKAYFEAHVADWLVFLSPDGTDLLLKASRTKPNVVILGQDVAKTSATEVHRHFRSTFARDPVTYIYLGSALPPSMKEDQSKGVLIWISSQDEQALNLAMNHALNSQSEFKMLEVEKGQTLIREGEDSSCAYLVVKGSLTASHLEKGHSVELGKIQTGEFVGEMGVLNSEKRMATVVAMEDCQLLEIPALDFNKVVLSKPNWAKAVMSTLTKRLSILAQRK